MIPRVARAAWLPVVAALALGTPSSAQNRDHPGMVLVGKNRWISIEDARAKGWVRYGSRWVPKKHARTAKRIEENGGVHLPWSEKYDLRTRHYRIETNVPRFVAEDEIQPFLDELYATFVKTFQRDFGLRSRGARADDQTVRIYDSREEFHRDSQKTHPMLSPTVAGYYDVGNEVLVLYYDETDPSLFYGTALHEAAHQFAHATFPNSRFPVWIEEAMGVWFEGCTYSRATRVITVHDLPPLRLARAQQMLSAEFATRGSANIGSLFVNVPRERFGSDEYALSWSFLYYLMRRDGGRHARGVRAFLGAMRNEDHDVQDVEFRKATGADLVELASDWPAFVRQLDVPESPSWVHVEASVPTQGLDLQAGDAVFTLDDVEIFSPAAFEQVWSARDPAQPLEITVRRQVRGLLDVAPRPVLVQSLVPANAGVELRVVGSAMRWHNLRD